MEPEDFGRIPSTGEVENAMRLQRERAAAIRNSGRSRNPEDVNIDIPQSPTSAFERPIARRAYEDSAQQAPTAEPSLATPQRRRQSGYAHLQAEALRQAVTGRESKSEIVAGVQRLQEMYEKGEISREDAMRMADILLR